MVKLLTRSPRGLHGWAATKFEYRAHKLNARPMLEALLYRVPTIFIGCSRSVCIAQTMHPRARRLQHEKRGLLLLHFLIPQLFLALAVKRPIPRTAHLRDPSTGSLGYSSTFRLHPWAISPTHDCTTRTQLTIIDIRSATVSRTWGVRTLLI